jgi:ribokinase
MASRPVVVVVGSVNVDLVVRAARLPRPGETVLGEDLERHGGGKGANAAVAAARLGAEVRLVAAVGRDELGAGALAELDAEGVDTDGVVAIEGATTGTALIVVDPAGENQIAVAAGANSRVGAGLVGDHAPGALAGAGVLLLSCEIPLDGVLRAAQLANAAGVPLVLNPAPVLDGVLAAAPFAPVLTPNATEAVALTGAGDPELAAHVLVARTGAPVALTLGGDGAVVAEPGGAAMRLPAAATEEVVDTTGAGDAFNGALAVALARGAAMLDAVAYAMQAAAHAVAAPGARAGMPSAEQLAGVVPRRPQP